MTVCPPKGSHNALNYDLMKADNNSLTDMDRMDLKETTFRIFTESSHKEFIKDMLTEANQENLEKYSKVLCCFLEPKTDLVALK